MNNELEKLIASGESGTVEFKASFGKAAIETMAAFANGEGGFLFVGISNKGAGWVCVDPVTEDGGRWSEIRDRMTEWSGSLRKNIQLMNRSLRELFSLKIINRCAYGCYPVGKMLFNRGSAACQRVLEKLRRTANERPGSVAINNFRRK